jgi:hypothetical protein
MNPKTSTNRRGNFKTQSFEIASPYIKLIISEYMQTEQVPFTMSDFF